MRTSPGLERPILEAVMSSLSVEEKTAVAKCDTHGADVWDAAVERWWKGLADVARIYCASTGGPTLTKDWTDTEIIGHAVEHQLIVQEMQG